MIYRFIPGPGDSLDVEISTLERTGRGARKGALENPQVRASKEDRKATNN